MQRNGQLLYKRFAEYFIPTMLMAVALSMSIVVDGIIVGNMLGPEALAAVNLGSPLITVYSVIFSLFGVGGSILVTFFKEAQIWACKGVIAGRFSSFFFVLPPSCFGRVFFA